MLNLIIASAGLALHLLLCGYAALPSIAGGGAPFNPFRPYLGLFVACLCVIVRAAIAYQAEQEHDRSLARHGLTKEEGALIQEMRKRSGD